MAERLAFTLFAKQLLASVIPLGAAYETRQARHFLFDRIEKPIKRLFCVSAGMRPSWTKARCVHVHSHLGITPSQESVPDPMIARIARTAISAARK
jgi:hypothetical protein